MTKDMRPGLKAGRSNEFILTSALKPGGAERLQKKMVSDSFAGQTIKKVDRIGTVHDNTLQNHSRTSK